jgi:hypothetical protein
MRVQVEQRPCSYRIRLDGELAASSLDALRGTLVTVERRQDGRSVTVLFGTVPTQDALADVLAAVAGLQLPLLSVEVFDSASRGEMK